MKTRILIADDHKPYRDGLKMLINQQDDLEVVGTAENGEEAVRLAFDLHPDVILMDVKMPVMDGIEATRLICTGRSSIKIIALSMYSGERYFLGMRGAGAVDYVVKGDDFEEVYKAIQKAADLRKF